MCSSDLAAAIAIGERQHITDPQQVGLAEIDAGAHAAGLLIAAIVAGERQLEGAGADGFHLQVADTGLRAGGEVGRNRFDQRIGLQQAQHLQQPRLIQHPARRHLHTALDVLRPQPSLDAHIHLAQASFEDADLHNPGLIGLHRDIRFRGCVALFDIELHDRISGSWTRGSGGK